MEKTLCFLFSIILFHTFVDHRINSVTFTVSHHCLVKHGYPPLGSLHSFHIGRQCIFTKPVLAKAPPHQIKTITGVTDSNNSQPLLKTMTEIRKGRNFCCCDTSCCYLKLVYREVFGAVKDAYFQRNRIACLFDRHSRV